jgi:hypothetical protein
MARHKAHIDAAYQDFKDRVCEGRNISPELIEILAGGRVYTGKAMWELNEKLSQGAMKIDEPEAPQKVTDEKTPADENVMAPSQEGPKVDESNLTTSSTNHVSVSSSVDSSNPKVDEEVKPLDGPHLEGLKTEIKLHSSPDGPLGQGIIDGIGGIREAAVEGAERYLNRLIEQTRQENPDKSEEEIMEEVLPGVPYVPHDNGAATMSFDIRLKKCTFTFLSNLSLFISAMKSVLLIFLIDPYHISSVPLRNHAASYALRPLHSPSSQDLLAAVERGFKARGHGRSGGIRVLLSQAILWPLARGNGD